MPQFYRIRKDMHGVFHNAGMVYIQAQIHVVSIPALVLNILEQLEYR